MSLAMTLPSVASHRTSAVLSSPPASRVLPHWSGSQSSDPEGWPGVFQPLRHHVPIGARRLILRGALVVFAICDAPCSRPTDRAWDLPWCPICRRFLDTARWFGPPAAWPAEDEDLFAATSSA